MRVASATSLRAKRSNPSFGTERTDCVVASAPRNDGALFTSPRRGEVGLRSNPGEGDRILLRASSAPHPNPLPIGEREQSARTASIQIQTEMIR
ncbi:MAG: hypothetical protein EKK35_09360 [Bradyrhizobiaceae bacterium]|nr:MAG: hypothetical protein EKK35_09360 [Bradyrhizobiaceae bacterium]